MRRDETAQQSADADEEKHSTMNLPSAGPMNQNLRVPCLAPGVRLYDLRIADTTYKLPKPGDVNETGSAVWTDRGGNACHDQSDTRKSPVHHLRTTIARSADGKMAGYVMTVYNTCVKYFENPFCDQRICGKHHVGPLLHNAEDHFGIGFLAPHIPAKGPHQLKIPASDEYILHSGCRGRRLPAVRHRRRQQPSHATRP